MVTGELGQEGGGRGEKFCKVNIAADAGGQELHYIPDRVDLAAHDDAAYVHYVPNETIAGVEFHFIPDVDAPLVADMSSTILSRPVDVDRFGMIYAGAQKNVGPAGIALVIARRDLLDRAPGSLAHLMTWRSYAESESMTNTPPTFAWYVADKVFEWLLAKGGVEAMAIVNERKARKLYGAIDASQFYSNPVSEDARSWMNVPFLLADPSLDKTFLAAGGGGWPCQSEGPSLRRRHARLDLQCSARGGGRRSHRFHAEFERNDKVLTLNNIAVAGLRRLPREQYESHLKWAIRTRSSCALSTMHE